MCMGACTLLIHKNKRLLYNAVSMCQNIELVMFIQQKLIFHALSQFTTASAIFPILSISTYNLKCYSKNLTFRECQITAT